MNEDLFTEDDRRLMESRGVRVDLAARQVHILRNPPSSIRLVRPCHAGDGIERIEGGGGDLVELGREAAAEGRVTKFVPASGAASRMFKDLIAALEDLSRRPSTSPRVRELFERLDEFPFGSEVRRRASFGVEPETEDEERRALRVLLHDLGYASRPKALIPFHRDAQSVRTAFEEQLGEACKFAAARDGQCRVHFTVSRECFDDFDAALQPVATRLQQARGCTLDVSFSVQHPSTDTLALDSEGQPFRSSDGALLFRPGGHGALLRNLAASEADIVVVKNIDNILPDAAQEEAVRWKATLIGKLVRVQTETFALLAACSGSGAGESEVDRALHFVGETFARRPVSPLASLTERRVFAIDALDRPIRICGVVANEGEPGGAPFWTADRLGGESIQIVESSQVSFADEDQARIWASSTHFNPVDLVCGLRNFEGRPFDLTRFVDEEAVFVARKSHEGRDLFGLELPGLWNGAMAGWNTLCVEVPAATFAPVKTVFDLLRPQHQGHR